LEASFPKGQGWSDANNRNIGRSSQGLFFNLTIWSLDEDYTIRTKPGFPAGGVC
jgi:hypothetical protein